MAACETTTLVNGQQVANPAPVEVDAKKRADVRLQLASRYYQQRQYQVALSEIRQALQAEPNLASAYALMGLIYMDLDDRREAESSFEKIGRKWWARWSVGKSPRHADTVMRRLEADVFPVIGHKFIDAISAADLRELILPIEARGARDVAKRAHETIGQIFRYAIANGLAKRNPAADFKPRDILSDASFRNAIATVLALGLLAGCGASHAALGAEPGNDSGPGPGDDSAGDDGGSDGRNSVTEVTLDPPASAELGWQYQVPAFSVDPGTEEQILESLFRLEHRPAILLATHRRSALLRVNRIVVLDEGKIVASGTHEGLIREGGLYADLYHREEVVEELEAL